jgi:hypothetical protein
MRFIVFSLSFVEHPCGARTATEDDDRTSICDEYRSLNCHRAAGE